MTHTTILLIRHGETAWNAVRRLQGHIDIPLNEKASARPPHWRARWLPKAGRHRLQRPATRHADGASGGRAARRLQLQTDAGLRERAYGVFEGMLYQDIQQQYRTTSPAGRRAISKP
jgi:probable phosphoglycerate mutase